MKFDGHFYNPVFSGEGFALKEYDDGKVIGYFYSYGNNEQLWLQCIGQRVGAVADLEVTQPVGGKIHDAAELAKVQELPWGKIILTDSGTDILAEFKPLYGPSWQYALKSLYDVPAAAVNQIKLEQRYGNSWLVVDPLPIVGMKEVNRALHGTGIKAVGTYRVTVLKGTMTIDKADVSGFGSPAITGAKALDVFAEGQVITIKTMLGPLQGSSQIEYASFFVSTIEHGTIIDTQSKILP